MPKLLLQRKSSVTFCENIQKKRNMIIEIISCDFDKSESWIFKIDPCYPKTLPATLLTYMSQRQEEN